MSLFEQVNIYVQNAAQDLKIGENILRLLVYPDRILKFEVPLERKDGSIATLPAFRVEHKNIRGPYIGGLRFHPGVTEEGMMGLSSLYTWQSACFNLPFGGSMGGIVLSISDFSPKELEKITRRYVQNIRDLLGFDKGIILPDLNTTPEIMTWILDEYSKNGSFSPGVVLGKPPELFGITHPESVGIGGKVLAFLTEVFLEDWDDKIEKKRIIILGFGNLGQWSAHFFEQKKAIIVGVSDEKGGVYTPEGIDIQKAITYKRRNRTIKGAELGEPVTNAELIEKPSDILVVASQEGTIGKESSSSIQAKYLIEGAFGAITPPASSILEEKGIKVLPDILSNAGRLVSSYYEWIQNIQMVQSNEEEVWESIKRRILATYRDLSALVVARNISLRDASYIIALGRVAKAFTLRGI